jgi:uncharacterized membrane protein YphA (DoxX/SURF4 family)
MRIVSVGHAVFAATIIGLGILGLLKGDFATIWQPVPTGIPARAVLAYLSGLVFVGSGIGVLWPPAAALAARVLLIFLLLWLLVLRMPAMFVAPNVETSWAAGKTAIMLAAVWILYVWLRASRYSLAYMHGWPPPSPCSR